MVNRENTGKVGKGNPPEATRFKKGVSGNMNGRPRKLPELEKLLAEVLGEEKKGRTEAQAILHKLKLKALSGDVKAAEILLDRAYGKSKQFMDLNANITNESDIYIGGKKIPND